MGGAGLLVKSLGTRTKQNRRGGTGGSLSRLIDIGILPVLVVLVVAMGLLNKNFLSISNASTMLQQMVPDALLASAETLVILTAGIDLSVGSILGLAGIVTGVTMQWFHWSVLASIVAALVAGLACGALNGLLVTTLSLVPFVVTLGTMGIYQSITLVVTGGTPFYSFPRSFQSIGQGFLGPWPEPALALVVAYGVLWYILKWVPYGRHVYAVGDEPVAALRQGVSIRKTQFWAYTVAGLLAAEAGVILTSTVNSAEPLAGNGSELNAIAACVIGGISLFGGRGSIVFVLAGAAIIEVIENGLNIIGVSPYLIQGAIGTIIVLAVLVDKWRQTLRTNLMGRP